MGGTARRHYEVEQTAPYTAERQFQTNGARGWLVSAEVARWLANVAADIPEHAINETVTVTVEWR